MTRSAPERAPWIKFEFEFELELVSMHLDMDSYTGIMVMIRDPLLPFLYPPALSLSLSLSHRISFLDYRLDKGQLLALVHRRVRVES